MRVVTVRRVPKKGELYINPSSDERNSTPLFVAGSNAVNCVNVVVAFAAGENEVLVGSTMESQALQFEVETLREKLRAIQDILGKERGECA